MDILVGHVVTDIVGDDPALPAKMVGEAVRLSVSRPINRLFEGQQVRLNLFALVAGADDLLVHVDTASWNILSNVQCVSMQGWAGDGVASTAPRLVDGFDSTSAGSGWPRRGRRR